ncbi:MAG: hypothetical protein JSR73_02020 [Proteobacteria bacterium]|nr:hypothetical protein [Pseudomonadota bacterium]
MRLRRAVTIGAAALAAIGTVLCLAGMPAPGAQLLGLGVVVLVGVAIERWRYRTTPRPGADWQPTGERFVDPESGRSVDVFYDPKTGERRYRTDGDRGAGTG